MTETKDILKKIAALRVRLDQAQGPDLEKTVPHTPLEDSGVVSAVALLDERARNGSRQNRLLDDVLRQISADGSAVPLLPPKLTARGHTSSSVDGTCCTSCGKCSKTRCSRPTMMIR